VGLRGAINACFSYKKYHTEKASEDYGQDTRTILVELGKRKMAGCQEEMITDTALDLVQANAK
jgi:4-hydroxy 2-oxovalerate aldolase